MKLLILKLRNFKGVKSFTLDTQGGDVAVFGKNGTGKTTLADAFMWLLFDKDSCNRKQFDIKTLDADNRPIHHLEHEVEAVLSLDSGKQITLRKVFKEKWTKKRGQAHGEFTGHTTTYYINDVPVKKTEYAAKVAEIADEEVFRLLTDPTHFNVNLHWEKRRALLLEVCGDISDADVIASDKALAKLPDIIGDRTLDEHKKVITEKRKKINDELKLIPARIDEVQRGLPELPESGQGALDAQLAELREAREAKAEERARLENGGEIAEKQKRLAEINAELMEIENEYWAAVYKDIDAQKARLSEVYDQARDLKGAIREANREINSNQERIAHLSTKRESLLDRWHQYNNLTFEHHEESVCPTCGQDIPQEQLDAAREKALAEFNTAKAEKLQEITAEGKAVKAEIDELTARNVELTAKVAEAEQEFAKQERLVGEIQNAINLMQEAAGDYATNLSYQAKMQERDAIKAEIDRLKSGNTEAVERITGEIEALDQEITVVQGRLAQIAQHERGQARIKELEARERELAAEFERLEGELYLCDQFTRVKVALLDEKINSRFQHARFKLFKENINGGIESCCETLYGGVPYGSNLNTGAKCLVGVDIINTLADYYGFAPPVFLDNAESVTEPIETRGQLIRLIASTEDNVLRVEREANFMREVI